MNTTSSRIDTIDVFRAITMLLMIFVNDLWTLHGVPKWLEHAASNEDFLGLADTVFPAFLFIVGMSIPFAIRNRLKKGESNLSILKHVVIRSGILIVMGVFTVNLPDMDATKTGLSESVFEILMVVGFFLCWNVYPVVSGKKKWIFNLLEFIGLILLVYLAYIFRGHTDEAGVVHGIEFSWWGILGLIGWTYLLCAPLYLVTKNSKRNKILIFLGFLILFLVHHAGWFSYIGVDPMDWLPGAGAFHVFTFGGVLLSSHIETHAGQSNLKKLFFMPFVTGFVFILAGIITRQVWIMSKIQATPPWVLLCSGISILAFLVFYFLVDLKKMGNLFQFIKPAGTSTLTCYILPYLVYSLLTIFNVTLPAFLTTGIIGLVKSLLFAVFIIFITGLLGKAGVRLKI
jgi:heparan-alpha-glucosaminide N-acetyltransferase